MGGIFYYYSGCEKIIFVENVRAAKGGGFSCNKKLKRFVSKKNNTTFAPAFEKQRNIKKDDSVAQQVEHIPFKDGVLGSNPS